MAEADRKEITLDGTQVIDDEGVWWTKPDDEIGAAMVQVARVYESAQFDRREVARRYVQLFKGQLLNSFYDAASPRRVSDDLYATWNVVQAAINTAASVVTRNRVRVVFETSGADYEMMETAKQCELAIQGIFARNKVYERIDPLWFLDAGATGLGTVICEPDRFGNACADRMIPDELIYSDVEAINANPRQIFRVQWRSKWEAVEEFGDTPEKRAAILACTAYEFPLPGVINRHVPLIPIYTGWFLPPAATKPGEDTVGRRVVGIPGATLAVRKYRHTRFPMAFFRVEVAPAGLHGISIAERVAGFQYRLNELNFDIEVAARLAAVGKWMVDTGSNVNTAELSNLMAGVVKYTGTPPKYETIDGIPRDLINERTTTYQQALKELGLSEWAVGGMQPENIESGEGLRALREQEQGRALPCGQHWEAAHVDLAEIAVMAILDGHEIAKEKKTAQKMVVKDPDGDGLTTIDLAKLVKFLEDPDASQVQAYPTSALPTDPAGRFEALREWRKDGTIDDATFAALSDMPDLNQESSLLLAGIKSVRHAISEILKKGEPGYEPPDPAMPLELGIKIAQSSYLKGLRTGVPEAKLALLKSWIADARELLSGAPVEPTAPPPGGPPPAPTGSAAPGTPASPPPPPVLPSAAPGPAPAPALTGPAPGG